MRLLVLQHISCEPPGVFSEVMLEQGVEPIAVELDENEPLPDWREFDAVLAMGGPMGADDDDQHPWLTDEKQLVRDVVEAGRPFLGVCLGVQLLASALGAPVRTMDSPELGLLPVELTAEGREHPLFEGVDDPFPSLQWHGDTFDLPDGAVALASSPVATQAFQAGERGFGIQFHLEVTPEMAREWAQVPEYRAYLAEALDAERADAFLAELAAPRRGAPPHRAPAVRQLAEARRRRGLSVVALRGARSCGCPVSTNASTPAAGRPSSPRDEEALVEAVQRHMTEEHGSFELEDVIIDMSTEVEDGEGEQS